MGTLHWRHLSSIFRNGIALLFCSSVALLAAALFRGHSIRIAVPYMFVVAVAFAAARWGAVGAMMGLAVAALVFSAFLFQPIGSISVQSDDARLNLALMIALGLSSCFLVAKPPPRRS
jgi:integral membrane sensor domain MASE1